MKHLLRIILLAITTASLSSCAMPINQHLAREYAIAAHYSAQAGDWDAAGRQWARAVHNADLGFMKKDIRAVYYYEYGRATGVRCHFDIAEEYLNKAYVLDSQINGPAYMSLVELFRLNLDQKKYPEAIAYFKRALPELEKVKVPTESLMEFAKLLEEYAIALNAIGDTQEAAKVQKQRAELGVTVDDAMIDRTPYGLYCE